MWNSSNAFSFFFSVYQAGCHKGKRNVFLWKKHGHCFINLQEPIPINHVTATQFLLNPVPNVINTAAWNNYLNEDKKVFQPGSTETRSARLGKGGLQTEGCQAPVTSLRLRFCRWRSAGRERLFCLLCRLKLGTTACPSTNDQSPGTQHPSPNEGFQIGHPTWKSSEVHRHVIHPHDRATFYMPVFVRFRAFQPYVQLRTQAAHRLYNYRNNSNKILSSPA